MFYGYPQRVLRVLVAYLWVLVARIEGPRSVSGGFVQRVSGEGLSSVFQGSLTLQRSQGVSADSGTFFGIASNKGLKQVTSETYQIRGVTVTFGGCLLKPSGK